MKNTLKRGVNSLVLRKIGLGILFSFLLIGFAEAQTKTSTSTGGLWAEVTTWVGGVVPLAGDNVIIATTGSSSVDVQANITQTGSVTVNSGAILASTSSASLVTIGSLIVSSGGTVNMNRPFTVSGTTTISGTVNFASSSSTSRAMTFTGDVTLFSGAIWTEPASGNGANNTYSFGSSITNNASTFNALGTGVHTFSGASKTISGSTTTSIPSLSITGTFTNSGVLSVSTVLSGSGTLTNGATGTLNIGGTSTITSISAATAGNTVNFNGSGSQTIPAFNYYNLTSSSSGGRTLVSSGTIGIAGTFTTGTNTYTTTGSTINFNGSGDQSVPVIAYNNLTFSTSGTKSLAGATTIGGLFTISNAAVANLGGFSSTSLTLTLGGTSQPAGSTTYGGTGSAATTINTTYFATATGVLTVGTACTPGTWTGTTSTDWNTASNWCGGVPTTSTNVVIPNVTRKPTIGTAGGLCNNITINSSSTLIITGSNTLTVSGNWTNNGTFTRNTSTVIFNGTTQSIGTGQFYNLTISGSGTKTLGVATTSNGALTINSGATLATANLGLTLAGNFVNSGTFTGGSSAISITGTTTQSIGGFTTTGAISVTKTGGTATITGNVSAASFASTTAATNSIVAINPSISVTLTGGVTLARPPSGSTTGFTLDVGAGSLICTTITLSGSTTTGRISVLKISTGTVTASGNITSAGTNSQIIFTGAGTLNAGGTFMSGTAGTFTCGTGTVNFNSSATQAVAPFAYTFYNLTLSNASAKTTTNASVSHLLSIEGTATASAAVIWSGTSYGLQYKTTDTRTVGAEWPNTFAGSLGVTIANTAGSLSLNANKIFNNNVPLTINNGATLNTTSASNRQLTLGGNLVIIGTGILTANASPIVIGAGTATQSIAGFTTTGLVSMTKTGGTATFTGNITSGGITVNGSGGTLNLGSNLTHTLTGVVTLTAGTLNGGSSTLNENMVSTTAWNGTGSNFVAGTGTVNFGAAGNQTLSATATTFNNLTFTNSGTKTFSSATTINGDLAISTGVLANLGTGLTSTANTLTFITSKQASGSWGSTAATSATNKNSTYFGTTATGILNVTASCVAGTWSGATSTDWNVGSNWCNSIVPTSSTNVTIPSGGNQPVIGAAGGVCNNIILNSGATLTITGSNTLTVSGDWTNNSGTFTPNTGSVIFNNTTDDQNILGSIASQSFYNLTVSKSTFKLILDKPVTVGGTLTMTSGHIDASSNTLELGTSTAATGTLNYTSGNILGNFKRWINAPGALLFPVGTASASNMALVTFTDLTAGSLTAFFTATDPGWNNTAVLTENSVIIDHQFPEGYWTMTAANSLASTNYSLSLTGDGFATYTEDNTVRIMQRASSGLGWALPGTHNLSAYVTPTAQRSGLAVFGEFAHGALRTCSLSASVAKTNTTCGSNDGTITVSSPSGATNYEYRVNAETWQADGNFTGLAAGTYSVQMRDADATGCTVVLGNQTVSQPAVLTLTASVTDESCSSNGAINITAGGGATPYTYDWADLPGTNNAEDRTGVLAGTYTVTFTDANGCTFTSDNIVVASPVGICDGVDVCKSDAAKVFSVTPDPEVITYTWTVPATAIIVSGQNTSSITVDWTAVAVGAYQVSVRSVNTCSESAETLLTIYVKNPAASAQVIGALCVGSNVQLSASGGQSYAWTGPNGFTSSSANPVIYNATASDNGIYSVIVTDQKGCSANASVTITLNTPPTETSIISPSACGASTGGINISPSGGSSFTYLWNNGATTQDISSIPAGNYSVVITNNLGCSIVGNYTVGNTGGPTASVAQTNVLCNGSSTGDITLTVSGGTPGVDPEPLYTYLWSNGSVDQDLTGLAAGTYSVIITDGAGCTGAASAIITQPNALQLDKVLTEIKCFGASTGAINITVTGGTGPYSYDWGGGITSEDRSAIPAGNYSVTVTDASSCTVTGSFTITQPALVLSAGTVVANISCNGSANGLVNLTVSGGTAPYTYLWTRTESGYAGATTEDIAALSPGTYHVTVIDANNCSTTSSGIITEPDLLSLSKTQTNVSCKSGSNGTVNLTVSGGTAPYTFAWSNGAITEDLSALAAGTYSVIVTDAHACSATTSATITEPAAVLGATITGQANVLCHSGTTGAATATVTGGTSPYTYAWNTAPVQTAATATGLIAGLYSVVVTDANLCTTTKSVTITQPSAISISGSVTNVLCYSGTSGSINITASGGTGSYTYNWGGGITTEDRTSLSAGTYTVTVTDASSCNSAATSFTITQPSAAITPSMVNSNITCKNAHNGSINLSVTGGVSPYTYLWTGGATTEDLTNLNPGTYSVTVTDANLCTATLSSSAITEPAAVLSVVATPTAVTCKDGSNGSISASPGGGTAPYSYSWSTGATTSSIGSLKAGVYNLTVTDHNGCTATTSVEVTQPSTQIELFATSIESSSCGLGTGSIDLSVVNGIEPFTYAWTRTAVGYAGAATQDIAGLSSGVYHVTVTDASGCSSTLSETIGTAPALSVSITSYPRTCISIDGSAYAIVTGGVSPYTYLWTNGATTQEINNLVAGDYSVTVTDANGCTATNTGTVSSISCVEPIALTDILNTNYNTLLSGTVATNDSDPDGESSTLQFFNETLPTEAQGILSWGTDYDGLFTFTPTIGFAGTFTLAYKVFDLTGLSTSGIISITVGPNAVNDPIGTNLNTPVSGNVTTNDVYEAGSSFTRLTSPAKGICTFNADGTFTYTPNTGEVGDDSFTYSVCLPEPNTSVCSTGTVLISIDGQADIQLSKTVDEATPNVGSHVIFTLTATNNGPNLAMGVSVSDVLPSGYTFFSDDGGSATNEASGTVTWTVGSLANAATATLHVTALVNPTGSYNNTATITGSNTDPSPDNNSASRSTVPVPQADLSISKTANNPSQSVGQPIIFTLTVTNNGPSAASGVSVTDILPSGYTYVSDNGASAYNSATGVWTIGTLNNSGTATLNITATVLASGTYTNTATITSSTVDPTPGNNSSTLTPIPGAVADLSIVKTVNNSSPYVGSYIEFTLTVTNNGPSTSTGVVVTDALPTGYTYTSDDGSTASTELAGTVSWTVGNLANAATATLKITAKVNASGIYTNTATVGTSDQPDNNSSNNSSSVLPTSIVPQSDLAITKTVDNESPLMGNNVVFTLTVTNNGLSQASGVSVTDVLPSGYTYISNTAPSAGSFVAGTGVWTIGSLANAATATLAITAQVKSSGDYINSATVSATTADLTAWNNSSAKTINPNPIVIISNPAAVCSPSTVNLSLAAVTTGSASGLTYTYWRDAAATIPYATPTAATAGTWYIKGTTSSGGHTIESVTVTVNTLPTALSLAGSIICVSPGGTGTITSTTSTSGVSYQLYNASNVSVQVAKTGTGAGLTWSGLPAANGYYAVATNSATCNTVSNTVDVTTYANPTITTSGSVTTVCYSAGVQSTTLAYSATTNSPTSFSIDWDATANSAGLTDQGNTAFAFASGSGTLTGISVPAGTSAGGPYSGTMTILNANGCSNTHEVTLSVTALPVTSAISGNTSPICSATGISYSVTLSSGSSYAWTVPVGATITAGTTGPNNNQITVDFGSVDGDVTVVETNAANCSGNAKTLTISMSGCSEDADFSGTPLILCQNETVTFTNSSTNTTGSTSYSWDFGAGSSPATANTAGPHTVTYSSGGLKTVSLIITDGASNTETKTDYVTVNALPATPTISAGGPTTFCAGGSVTLTASTGTSYLWSNSATTASINVTTAGSYSVQVTDASGCQSVASAATVVTVNALPATPTISAGGSTTFCTGGSITLTASTGTSYLWSTSETTQNITVSTAGNYSVQVTNVSGCQSAASSATVVTVNALPTTPTISAGGPTTFCTGGSVTLTASAGTSYLWSTSETTQNITVSTAGNYSVQVTNASGCQSDASLVTAVTVNTLPATPTISAGGPTTFCTGGSLTLTASAGTSYLWSTSETTQSISVSTAGNYSVQVTNVSGCQSAASSATVVAVNALPTTPTISAGGPTTFCTGGSVTLTASIGTSYLWSNFETTASINVTSAGSYSVQVTNASGCQSAASAATVVTVNTCAGFIIAESGGSTGTSEAATSDALTVVLNAQPASDVVISVTSGDLSEGTLTVITLTFTPANWNSPQTVTVTGVDDNIIDGNITYNITLSVVDASSDNNFDTLADQTVSVTNTDNDSPGFTIAESGGSTGTSEAATSDAFTVVLNAQPASDVVISVTSGDLTEGTLSVTTLTYTPANWNTPQTVTVTGVDDNIIDGNITYNITLSVVDASSDNNFDTLADQTVSVTNTDNDLPGFTIAESGGSTGTSEAATSDALTVVLNAQPASDVVISVTSGDLTEGNLSVTTLTYTPANWNSPQTVTVTGVDDAILDGNINYQITLSVVDASSDNNFDTLADQTVSVTNTDNDSPGFTIAESGGSTGTSEAATSDAFTVVLNAQPASDVLISVTSADLTEGTLSVTTLTFTPANWNSPQTVTVTGVDDNIIDGNITYNITLSVVDASSDNNFDTLADQTVSVTNTDNDSPGFTIAESGGSTGTSEAATSDAFTVVLNAQPASDVLISVTSGDLTEGTLSVTTLTYTPANWNTPQTVTVTGVDDNIIDGNITYNITLSVVDASSDNNFDTLADQTVSVTNTDNIAPTAVNDTKSTNEDVSVTINVTANDTDSDGIINVSTVDLDPATAGIQNSFTVAFEGTYTVNNSGVVTFTSVANFNGTATAINYTVKDNSDATSNIATLRITVTLVNDSPIASALHVISPEDTPVNGTVASNFSDVDGDYLIVTEFVIEGNTYSAGTSVVIPNKGTLVIEQNGTFKFIPVQNFNGILPTISYTIRDGNGGTGNGDLFISIESVNDSPVMVDENLTVCSSNVLTGNILSNGDTDPDGTILTVNTTPVSGPVHGTFSIASGGAFIYTPEEGYNGPDQITVLVCDNGIPLPKACSTVVIQINVIHAVLVNAGTDATICEGSTFIPNASTVSNATSLIWTTSGTGTFSDASAIQPVYTPDAGDRTSGSVILTLTANSESTCLPVSDAMILSITHQATVNAGENATICEGSAYSLNASTVSNATSLIWTTSGTGTFSDASAIHPVYTPDAGDRTSGSVILTLTANSESPCLPVSDAMILSITHQATADAGTDAAICEGSAYSLNASTVSNATSLIWTTSGTGTFSDASAIHPVYTPGAGDRTSGSVILTLIANSESPCLPVSDAMILSITHQATANAGTDAAICEGSVFSLTSAVVSNVTSQIWSTSGTGLFSNIHLVNPSYSPSSADIAAGSVSLTLSAEGGSPCANASDAMVLFISHQAKVDAGENVTWGEGSAYQMNTASVSDATSVIWTTSGNGTFNDASVINPTYTASAADILQGSVILKLTAIAEGPCSAASDDMVLTLTTKLIVNAGPDVVLFGNSPFVLSAAFITNSTNGIWRTSGSGTFNNRSLINTTYIPSDADLRMGQVILTLTSGNLEDTIILTFSTKPAVSAGPDREACAGEYITINGATADYYSEIHWTSSGLGEISGSNTLSPVYKPALNETGDVTLIAAVSGLGSSSSQKSTDSMIIKYHEQMIVDAGASDTILLNTRAVLSASVYPETGNYTYSWSPAELVQNSTSNHTETIDLSSSIELVLTVTDVATGCQAKDSVRIVIENNIDNLLDIRNGISPNGDGDNDIWWIDGIEKFPDNEIIIFNRWGDKIIELRNYDNNQVAWDGKNKQGHLVTDGTYYYLIKINGIKTYTGWINLRSGSN